MAAPKVTVLLPVHNGERFIEAAVGSVLTQTFADFELLVIDDGSTDRTPELLRSFTDPRLRIEKNPENLRLIRSLNRGLELARGEYIARMDADDICFPERLEKQVAFLDANREIGVVGSEIVIFENDHTQGYRHAPIPLTTEQIRWELLRISCLYHPTVMIRHSVFETVAPYNPEYAHCEDYELWLRVSRAHGLANLPFPLLYYRRHASSISSKHFEDQLQRGETLLAGEIERRIGVRPGPVTTGALMAPWRTKDVEDFGEFREFFPKLLEEALARPGLTSGDRSFIRISAALTIARLLWRALCSRPKHLGPLLKLLLLDLNLGPALFTNVPLHLCRIAKRRLT